MNRLNLQDYLLNNLTDKQRFNDVWKVIEQELNKRLYIDYEKLIRFIKVRNVLFTQNPYLSLERVAKEYIAVGLFDKETKKPVIKPIFDDLKARHIYYNNARDTSYLETYLTYILTEQLLTESQLSNWLHNAVDYIATLEKPNAKYFKELFRKSKTMKALNLPYDLLDDRAEREKDEWNNLISKLDTD